MVLPFRHQHGRQTSGRILLITRLNTLTMGRLLQLACMTFGVCLIAAEGFTKEKSSIVEPPVYSDASELCRFSPNPTDQTTGRFALLIAVNDYADPAIPDLEGTINDACLLRRALINRLGFAPQNIKMLANEDATKQNVVSALKALQNPEVAETNGSLLVYFAGHGSQVRDLNADEMGTDGLDETLVLHDTSFTGQDDLRDDELSKIFRELAPNWGQLTVIFDSCHSGAALRASGRARRLIRTSSIIKMPPVRNDSIELSTSSFDSLFADHPNLVFLSGASESEIANEILLGGNYHGIFTISLVRALTRTRVPRSPIQLLDSIQVEIDRRGFDQTPTVEGAAKSLPFLSVQHLQSSDTLVAIPQSNSRQTSVFSVSSGALTGETRGSVYRLMGGDENEQTFLADVTSVSAFTSELTVRDGPVSSEHYIAKKVSHSYQEHETLIRLAGFEHVDNQDIATALTRLESALDDRGLSARLTEQRGSETYNVSIDDQQRYVLRQGKRRPIAITQDAEKVVQSIVKWDAWLRFSAIEGSEGLSLVDAALTGPKCSIEQQSTPQAFDNGLDKICVRAEGTSAKLDVKNNRDSNVWLNLFLLGPNGDISLWASEHLLQPGRSFEAKFKVPPHSENRTTYLFKVFATGRPVDLSTFQQGELRDGGANCDAKNLDQLNRLLCSTVSQNRGDTLVKTSDWSVTDLSISVDPVRPSGIRLQTDLR